MVEVILCVSVAARGRERCLASVEKQHNQTELNALASARRRLEQQLHLGLP